MATTGIVNTKILRVKFIPTTGTPVDINCLTDATFSVTTATRETTCKDSGQYVEILPAQTSWEISGTAYFAYSHTNGAFAVYDAMIAQNVCKVAFGTGVAGDVTLSGDSYCVKWDASSPGTNENASWSFTFTGTGAITKTTNS